MENILRNRRFIVFIIIVIGTILITTGISLMWSFNKTLTTLQSSLTENLIREKQVIELLYQKNNSETEIIRFLRETKIKSNKEISGESNIVRRKDDSLEVLVDYIPDQSFMLHQKSDKNRLPVKLAISGKTGFVKETDFRGREVYAAYTYIPGLKWGLVKKIEVVDVRRPYFNTFFVTLLSALFLILGVVVYFILKVNPLFNKYLEVSSRSAILFDNAADCVFIQDIKGNILDVNTTVCQRYGYSKRELINMHVRSLNSPKMNGVVNERLDTISKEKILFFETEHVSKNGIIFNVEVNAKIIEYQGQKAILSIARDITSRKQIENQIKVKDELLQMTSSVAKVGGWEFDPDTLEGTWTDEVARIHGLDPDNPTNVSIGIDYYLPESRKMIEKAIRDSIQLQKPYDLELELISEDKIHKWVRTLGFPVVENGKTIKVKGIFQDISDRKRAETELEKSRERLQAALEATNDGVWDVEMQTGEVYLSPRCLDILELNPGEVKTTDQWFEHVHPDDLPITKSILKEHYLGNTPDFKIEERFKTTRGDWKWVYVRGKVESRDSEGNPVRVLGTCSDIMQRKVFEEALKESEERYRTFVEVSIDAIFINENNCITYLNPSALRLFEAEKPEDILGKSPFSLFYSEFHEVIKDRIKAMEAGGGSVSLIEEKIVSLKGKVIDVEVAATPFKLRGKKAILVVLRDISARKIAEEALNENQYALKQQNEEYLALNEELNESNQRIQDINSQLIIAKDKAEESDRLKSAFLANMSHEIRTPMNAIIGFSQLLSKEDISYEKRERFSTLIQQRTYDLLRIVEDILDVSKIEVGQLNIILAPTDLKSLMSELFDYYQQKLKTLSKKDMDFRLESDPGLENVLIQTDAQRLKQVLGNLLDNAFKFTPSGNISFGYRLQGDSEIIFFVKDSGIGIPLEKQNLIFDRFRQAEEALSARQYGGSGLGLSIVKGISNLLHGKIWIESEVNKGSTFWFSLPFLQPEKVDATDEELEGGHFPRKNKSILIVEDDMANMEYLKEVLSETGLNIYCAYNGRQVWEQINKNPQVSLVLMDIRLPDTNGLLLTKEIKKLYPHISVIAQTAYASNHDIQECAEAGCNDYISKPINGVKLLNVVGKHLN